MKLLAMMMWQPMLTLALPTGAVVRRGSETVDAAFALPMSSRSTWSLDVRCRTRCLSPRSRHRSAPQRRPFLVHSTNTLPCSMVEAKTVAERAYRTPENTMIMTVNNTPDSAAPEHDVAVRLGGKVVHAGAHTIESKNGFNYFGNKLGPLVSAVPPHVVTFAAVLAAYSRSAVAAVTGGRIGGGYTAVRESSRPSAPPIQHQFQDRQSQRDYSPSQSGRDIYGSAGSRVHVSHGGQYPGARLRRHRRVINPDAGDVVSTTLNAADVAMIGGVSAGVMALQRRNRKRYLEENGDGYDSNGPGTADVRGWQAPSAQRGAKETAVVTTLQVAMFCERRRGQGDVLGTLESLSQRADVQTPRGLSALVNEVCLTLLRSEQDWVGTSGGVKEYAKGGRASSGGGTREKTTPRARAKRDFNRAVMRERAKWERETVSTTPERGFSSSRVPGSRGSTGAAAGTYAVATLMIAWAGVTSAPPQAEVRKGGSWWWRDGSRDDDAGSSGFVVKNRQSAITLLEWLADEAAAGRGENVLDLEVLWTPADADDSLDRDDLYAKWPEMRNVQ